MRSLSRRLRAPFPISHTVSLTAMIIALPMILSTCSNDKTTNPTPGPVYSWHWTDTSNLQEAAICGLRSVSGAGKDFVLAVGCEHQIAQRFSDGWSVGCCDLGLGVWSYYGVNVQSRGYAVVVGESADGALYDGGQWTHPGYLGGWEVWAIGYREFMYIDRGHSTLWYTYPGNGPYDPPYCVATLPVYLNAIWGSNDNSLFRWIVVGEAGNVYVSKNNQDWSRMDTGVTVGLNGVGGVGDHVFIVGEAGTILALEGDHFVLQKSGVDVGLQGVWVRSANEAWAVGNAGTVLHYDGTSWQKQKTPAGTGPYGLKGVWASSSTDVIAVGQTDTGDAPVIIEYR